MNAAILLSGGTGSRIPSEIPKQYIRVKDRMLVTYPLGTLLKSAYIDMVEIVAAPQWRDDILEDVRKAGLDIDKISGFADPGVNRQGSILNGMEEILRQKRSRDMSDADTVFIHDAARPFLTGKLIADCYAALAGHDGVMPVLPMKDTVYLSSSGTRVEKLLERSRIYAGQAPELFLLGKYYRANRALLPDRIMGINGSTEPAIMAGMDIAMIPGDEGNFKVTTEADLQRFREYIERREG